MIHSGWVVIFRILKEGFQRKDEKINNDIKNRIFEPFFTTKTGGMNPGLGLSTALEIIQDLKGGISVDSMEGEFAEFKITIPKK